ncbi:MAG: hypothetical protein LBQ66_02720, partial [Planctomycetaceae bacterium]|nr:hypothetical protein [Planctomycetaceae bacterium]
VNTDKKLVNQEIAKLEKVYETETDMYIYTMNWIINSLRNNNKHWRWFELINELNNRILAKEPESNEGRCNQIEAIICMSFDPEDSPTSINVNRKKRVSKMLELWQSVTESIEAGWEFNDPKNFIEPYSPPRSYEGVFFSNISPDVITDPKVKKEYIEYLEKQSALLKKAWEQKWAREVVSRHGEMMKKYIVDSYSLQPFATAELEQLLKTYKLDEVSAKKILEAVRKAEKEAPPISEFRNWETTDGLFKAKAKFISANDKTVTIEKENRKKVTLNIEDLRWSDKNVIKEKTKTPTDKKEDKKAND